MEAKFRPILLLADSQLLFWKDQGCLFLNTVLSSFLSDGPRAAYIGAANGDKPEFYEIFTAAMAGIGIRDCRQILSDYSASDQSFVETAEIILLAGGDLELGWRAINSTALAQSIARRYREGACLIGVSAGAVHLGRFGLAVRGELADELIDTFNFFPFVVDVHDERQNWERLANVIRLLEGSANGIGIPAGGGIVFHPDQTLQAIRHPIYELSSVAGELRRNLLLPT